MNLEELRGRVDAGETDTVLLAMCDLHREDGSPVAASPRQVLAGQLDRLAGRGWSANAWHGVRPRPQRV